MPLPLQRLSGELDAVWRMQSLREPAAKRDLWKRKVEQVRGRVDWARSFADPWRNCHL